MLFGGPEKVLGQILVNDAVIVPYLPRHFQLGNTLKQ